jgi:hypothetical protein
MHACQCAHVRSISSKIKRAVTDSTPGISFDPELRPAVSNLVAILAAASGREPHDVRARVLPMPRAHVARAGGARPSSRQPRGAEAADSGRPRPSCSAHPRRH